MKSTKKSLIASALCLLLCFTMLVGTTYAWFTDKVEVTGNRIVAGNLDVEMEYMNANGVWADVETAGTNSFFTDINGNALLWEPGVVSYAHFKVANVGNLALKYNFLTVADNYNTVEGNSLKDVIKVYVLPATEDTAVKYADRAAVEAAIAEETAVAFEAFTNENQNLAPKTADYFTVILKWAPGANDNDYNVNNDKVTSDGEDYLWIDIDLRLVATQAMAESDSFGTDYDKNAWISGYDEEWYNNPATNDAGEYVISTPAELAAFAQLVNDGTDNFRGKTVVLANNIDLMGAVWTPIGTSANPFKGVFDGKGYTVSNLYVNLNGKYAGLFGDIHTHTDSGDPDSAVKNLTINNATVKGTECVGAAVGYAHQNFTLENVNVTGNVNIQGNTLVGGIIGSTYGKIVNCSVVGTGTVRGVYAGDDLEADNIGGIIGHHGEYTTLATVVSGSTVKGITVEGTRKVGGIIGLLHSKNKVENCTFEGTVTCNATGDYYTKEFKRMYVGGIVGEGIDSTTEIANCVAKGTVNGINPLATGAIVGGGRSGNAVLTNNNGSAVTVTPDTKATLHSDGYLATIEVADADDLKLLVTFENAGLVSHQEHGPYSLVVTFAENAVIDMAGYSWPSISGHFTKIVGNNATIENLTAVADASGKAGLFGYAGGTYIENLTLKNVDIKGAQAGAICGQSEGAKLINCKVEGGTVTFVPHSKEEWNAVGSLIGYNNGLKEVTNITVSNVTVVSTGITFGDGVDNHPNCDIIGDGLVSDLFTCGD